ncbi:MAG TPA: family 1 glycosylhydrolase [Candidatus Babeliales bacterium]|nr:family 1 glycosylhydrolase [Candidatus Babeliales bacterium]
MKYIQLSSILSIFMFLPSTLFSTTYWKWQNINTHSIQFPQSFEWGLTTLTYEVEGYSKASTWYAWENHINYTGQPFTKTRSGNSVAHADNYQQDVQLMREMGITTYCFSIDWSRVQPEQHRFDEKVLQHYIDLCDELINNGITVTVILKDYCDPLWWGYLGGFEHEKNLHLFEQYCLKMYDVLGDRVNRWITFWAPENYAVLGYLIGNTPPGVRNVHRAATVLKNELEAHVRVYKKIKNAPHGNNSRIGIIKHIHLLEPWHIWDKPSCYVANMLTNNAFYNFFTTGSYAVKIPLPGKTGAWVNHVNAYAPKSLDFVGINYYSHGYIKNVFNHVSNPSEIPTDVNGMTVYPEGLYFAIKNVSDNLAKKLNIPMIITQNGIATHDESIRDLFIKRHLYALSKAKADGYNLEGYYYYSFLDGFSWGSYDTQFGLCSVDRVSMKRKIKDGAHYFCDVIKK